MNKVFLGGTCADSTWREELIPLLNVDYFNPVVDNWTEEAQEEEERQKWNECNIHLYVITKEMVGVYSIAEAVESTISTLSIKRGITTIFFVIEKGFDEAQIKSLEAVKNLIFKHGGITNEKGEDDLVTLANFINSL